MSWQFDPGHTYRPLRPADEIYNACILDVGVNRPKRLAKMGWWGYTGVWEGRSRLLQRWGALLPLGLDCHPPAQATRLRTLELACESSS